MTPKRHKLFSSFTALNITQFFTALNDNLFKLLLVFFLITLEGAEHSNTILALAGAVFVIPFIVFASLAGTLADRYSKRTLIYFTRAIEILTTSAGTLAFYYQSAIGGYCVLFLMALHSCLFSPCKYGIIPEIVPKERISHCNGILTATTYLAIIVGTFFASFLVEITHRQFVIASLFCVLIAILGAVASLAIEKTVPQARQTKVSARIFSTILATLKRARQRRYLLTTLIFGAYFLFMGAYTQLNIIPFTLQSLHLSEINGGYLFLMTAIGIGLGSFLAGRVAGKEVELGCIPLAALGVGLCLVGLFVFSHHFYMVVVLLTLIGVFAGFYIVPVDAFIQIASPNADRGQNVAAANFLSFLGVVIASFLLAFLGNWLGFSAAEGFLTVGILTLLMGCALVLVYADQLFRLCVATVARLFCHITVEGKENILRSSVPCLLVAPRTSWIDTLVVMATLPRLLRYIVPLAKRKRRRSLLYRLLRFIPMDHKDFFPLGPTALKIIQKELQSGNSVCLMQPVDVNLATLHEWESAVIKCTEALHVPLVPIHLSVQPPRRGMRRWATIRHTLHQAIVVSYGPHFTRGSKGGLR